MRGSREGVAALADARPALRSVFDCYCAKLGGALQSTKDRQLRLSNNNYMKLWRDAHLEQRVTPLVLDLVFTRHVRGNGGDRTITFHQFEDALLEIGTRAKIEVEVLYETISALDAKAPTATKAPTAPAASSPAKSDGSRAPPHGAASPRSVRAGHHHRDLLVALKNLATIAADLLSVDDGPDARAALCGELRAVAGDVAHVADSIERAGPR